MTSKQEPPLVPRVMRRGLAVAALAMMLSQSAACATQTLSFPMLAPADVNLKAEGIASLGVSDFDGPGESGPKIAELFTGRLVEGRYFQVVERDKLLAMEKEQALGMTGVVDEKLAAKAGKLLGVDALVIGKVMVWAVTDDPYTKTVMQRRKTGTYRAECNDKGKCSNVENYEEVPVEESHHIRNGTVASSFRIVRADTGEVLTGGQETVSYRYDTGNPPSGQQELGHEETLNMLAQRVADGFAAVIQPHTIVVDREFENGGWFFGDSEVKQGIEYVRANRPEDAIARWVEVVKNDPNNSSAWYNLGVAYELTGGFGKADEAYRSAEKIEAKPRYIQAVSNLKKEAARRKKLEAQTK